MDYREYERDMYRRDGYPEGWGRERRTVDYDPHGRVVERYRVRRDFEGYGGAPEPDRWRDRPLEDMRGPAHQHGRVEGGWRGWVGGEGFSPRHREGGWREHDERHEHRHGYRHEGWDRGFEDEWRGREPMGTVHREYGGREFREPPREFGGGYGRRDVGGQYGRTGDYPGYTGGRPVYQAPVRREPDWEERYQGDFGTGSSDDWGAPGWRDGYGGRGGRTRQVGYGQFGATPRPEGSFSGRGPRGYRRGDDRIREDVCDRLCDHPGIDAGEVDVSIRDGEVTLQGSVSDRWMKRMAEDVAEGVQGVRQVHNHLRVADHASEVTANPATRPPATATSTRAQGERTRTGSNV
jgi:hypothetical protein